MAVNAAHMGNDADHLLILDRAIAIVSSESPFRGYNRTHNVEGSRSPCHKGVSGRHAGLKSTRMYSRRPLRQGDRRLPPRRNDDHGLLDLRHHEHSIPMVPSESDRGKTIGFSLLSQRIVFFPATISDPKTVSSSRDREETPGRSHPAAVSSYPKVASFTINVIGPPAVFLLTFFGAPLTPCRTLDTTRFSLGFVHTSRHQLSTSAGENMRRTSTETSTFSCPPLWSPSPGRGLIDLLKYIKSPITDHFIHKIANIIGEAVGRHFFHLNFLQRRSDCQGSI